MNEQKEPLIAPESASPRVAGEAAETCSAIDGIAVSELVAEHGSPLYVFSEASLRRLYRGANDAFRHYYPDVQFAWSYKTNYLRAICAVFHREGAIAEVVSDFEYEKARAGGVAGSDIIFNGPCKSEAALKRALSEGAKIQIDNFDELAAIAVLAESRNRPVDLAIRFFMDAGVHPVWSKFGFNADTEDALHAIEQIGFSRLLRLTGLHTHIGTCVLDPGAYARAGAKLVELAEIARLNHGFEVGYLNFGGGFPSRDRWFGAENNVPPIEAYAGAICKTIQERWPKGKKLPRLYLESGRALVDEAGYLICTVVAVKAGNGEAGPAGERTQAAAGPANYVVDAGINLLPLSQWRRPSVRPSRRAAGPLNDRTIYGCLCMNTDVLRQNVLLPDVEIGDKLVFHPVGAYNLTQSMQFITYRPRVVLITEQGQVEIIRERENLQHIEALERLPESLRPTSSLPPTASRR